MNTYTFEWPSKRLREQEPSAKPRIIARQGAFAVEYKLGERIKVQTALLPFDAAIEVASKAARENAEEVKGINIRQAQARHIRRAARLGLPVAA